MAAIKKSVGPVPRYFFVSFNANNEKSGMALGSVAFEYDNSFPPHGFCQKKAAGVSGGLYQPSEIALVSVFEFKNAADYQSYVSA